MARITNFVQPALQPPDIATGKPSVPSTMTTRMTVLYHLTSLDLYMLSPNDTTDVNTGFVLGSMNGVSSPFGQGTHGGSYLMPGTRVLVLTSTTTGYADVGGKHTAIHPIVSVDNEIPASDTWYWPVWKMLPDDWELGTSNVDKAIEAYHNIPETDRLKGKPVDRVPGDWEMGNVLKGHFYTGGSRIGMEASPLASLHMYSDDSTVVFNKGFNFVSDLPWARSGDSLSYDGTSVESEHRADTIASAMGQEQTGKLFTPSDISSVPANVKVKVNSGDPRWDWLNYRGREVGGKVSQRVMGRSSSNNPQPGVFSFEGVDGTVMHGVVNSMTLTRTPDLPYLEMLNEIGMPGHDVADQPEEETSEETFPVEMGDYATQYADLMYELMKRKFVERYWKEQKKNNVDWKTLSREDVARLMGRDLEQAVIRPLGGDEPAYKGQETTMKDPVADDVLYLSRMESYIHMSPSGAIVISDGTGSEIRLEGGHIILSPAVDIRVQPGRDAVFTVPRFMSMLSGDRMELTSDKGEIDVHADKSLVLSAEGLTLIESRGTSRVVDTSYDRRGEGGGVVIRSGSDTHVLGANIRLALQKGTDVTSDGIEAVANGMITLDAGESPLAMIGNCVSLHGDQSISASAGEGNGMLVDSNTIYMMANKIVFPINQSIFGGSGTMKWIDPRERELMSVYFSQPRSADVAVQGKLEVTDTLSAENVGAEKGCFKRLKSFAASKKEKSLYVNPMSRNGYQRTIELHSRWNDQQDDPEIDFSDEFVYNWFSVNADNPLMTAIGVKRLGIYYPMSSGYRQTAGFWVTSRWQRMLQRYGRTWSPTPIEDAEGNKMLPYPGFDGWTEMNFLKSWDADCSPVSTVLSGNWPVNAG